MKYISTLCLYSFYFYIFNDAYLNEIKITTILIYLDNGQLI